jgi:hypothetical protein
MCVCIYIFKLFDLEYIIMILKSYLIFENSTTIMIVYTVLQIL